MNVFLYCQKYFCNQFLEKLLMKTYLVEYVLRTFRLLTLEIAVDVKVAFIFKCTCDDIPRVHGKLPSTSTIQRAVDSPSGRLIQTQYCMLWTVSLLVKTRQNIFVSEVQLLWMFYICVLT